MAKSFSAKQRRRGVIVAGAIELIDALSRVEGATERLLSEAAKAGAEIVLADAKRRCPVSARGKTGRYAHPPGTLRDSLEIQEAKVTRTKATFKVFPQRNRFFSGTDGYYARFVELGTSDMEARPYLRPAIDENEQAIKDAMKRVFRKAIDGAW